MRILVTPTEACLQIELIRSLLPPKVEVVSTAHPVRSRSELARLLEDVDGAILDVEPVDDTVLTGKSSLRVISRFGVGCDSISLEVLRVNGIALCNTPGAMTFAVARQALAFILTLLFHITDNDRSLKKGEWVRQANRSIAQTTVGIIGLGAIGSELARLTKNLGFQVIGVSPRSRPDGIPVVSSLQELIEKSDVISLNMSLGPHTRKFVGWGVLNMMRGKYLVNTARGGVVDEKEVLRALEENVLLGYASDVFESEPVDGVSATLAAHPRVVASPHIGAYDPATAEAMVTRSVMNAIYCLSGQHERVQSYVIHP